MGNKVARERAPAKEGGTGGTLVAEPGRDRDEHETRLVYDSSNSGGSCTDTVIRYASENESDTAVLLTTANLMRVLQYVWGSEEKIESKWRTVGIKILQICPSKVEEITRGCTCNRERMERVIEFWLTWYPYASWRWWVEWFEKNYYSKKAEEMRKYAEPITDPTLTVANLSTLLSQSYASKSICIPNTSEMMAQTQYTSSNETFIETWSKWWLASSPNASWESIAVEFYRLYDRNALQLIKEYLKQVPESTLTVANVSLLLAPIKDLNKLTSLLPIPRFKVEAIMERGISMSQQKEALIQEYLDNHPAPSWRRVACAVYEMACDENCYGILEVIHRKYINDLSLQNLCIFAIRKFLKNPDDKHHLPLPDRLKSLIS